MWHILCCDSLPGQKLAQSCFMMQTTNRLRELFTQPLPSQWSYGVTADGRVFFVEWVGYLSVLVVWFCHSWMWLVMRSMVSVWYWLYMCCLFSWQINSFSLCVCLSCSCSNFRKPWCRSFIFLVEASFLVCRYTFVMSRSSSYMKVNWWKSKYQE